MTVPGISSSENYFSHEIRLLSEAEGVSALVLQLIKCLRCDIFLARCMSGSRWDHCIQQSCSLSHCPPREPLPPAADLIREPSKATHLVSHSPVSYSQASGCFFIISFVVLIGSEWNWPSELKLSYHFLMNSFGLVFDTWAEVADLLLFLRSRGVQCSVKQAGDGCDCFWVTTVSLYVVPVVTVVNLPNNSHGNRKSL